MCKHINPITASALDCSACERTQEELAELENDRKELALNIVNEAIKQGWSWDTEIKDWMVCPVCCKKRIETELIPFSLENLKDEIERQLGHSSNQWPNKAYMFDSFEICCSDCGHILKTNLPTPPTEDDQFQEAFMCGVKTTDLTRIRKFKVVLEAQNEIDAFIEKLKDLPPEIKGYVSKGEVKC